MPTGVREFALGAITVLLPCMTLTPVLALAATSDTATSGALMLLAFGLGTVPIMVGATYMPLMISRTIPAKLVKLLIAIFFLVAGIITFIR